MTDRELLELAAKAAGIPMRYLSPGMCNTDDPPWNPLTDDGDALRLAVRLNVIARNPGMRMSIDWQASEDPAAATRRAIVRAAAEIGKEMK